MTTIQSTNGTHHRRPHPFPTSLAIIGASISGLSLTLALLHARLFTPSQITIYDLRPNPTSHSSTRQSGFDPSTTASGVILTPNGLSVLSELGILQRIKSRCWTATHRTFRSDPGDRLVKKVRISGEELGYGFENHRCWRGVLVEELLRMVREKGLRIEWGCRFEGIVDGECEGGEVGVAEGAVKFRLSRSGSSEEQRSTIVASADMLVGADGIYSSVRKYLDPDAKPIYTGTTGVLAHIRWDDVDWPAVDDSINANGTKGEHSDSGPTTTHPYERQCTLQGTPGALFFLPEDAAGSVIMVGKQTRMPEPIPSTSSTSTRQAWESLAQNKSFLADFYREGYDQWGATGRKIIDAVCDSERGRDTLYLWPFLRMEMRGDWFKTTVPISSPNKPQGTALILGDAAHALPPSSGQGVNQSLEDVWTLAKILALVKNGEAKKELTEALQFWQEVRRGRIEEIYDWATNQTNVSRLSRVEREKEKEREKEGKQAVGGGDGKGGAGDKAKGDDMRWLYKPEWEQVITQWAGM